MSDKQLLEYYMEGFNDELRGKAKGNIKHLLIDAYKLGSDHAILGDDISSIDNLTNEEILKMLKK